MTAQQARSPKKREQIIGIWKAFEKTSKDFEKASKDLWSVSSAIVEAEQTSQKLLDLQHNFETQKEEISKLRESHRVELTKKDKAINVLDAANSVITEKFEIRIRECCSNLTKVNTEAKISLETYEKMRSSERDKMTLDYNVIKLELDGTKKSLDEKSTTLFQKEEQLKRAQKELNRLKNVVEFKEISGQQLSRSLDQLCKHIHGLTQKFFYIILPDSINQDKLFQECAPLRETYRASFPISNSPVSRQLRATMAEAAIARTLCREIFRYPIFPKSVDQRSLTDVSEWLTSRSQIRGKAFQSMLIASYTQEERDDELNAAVAQIVKELEVLLLDNQRRDFGDQLKHLLTHAASLWQTAQQDQHQFVAELEADDDSMDYEKLVELESTATSSSNSSQRLLSDLHPFLITFPRVILKDNSQILHPGYVSWLDTKLAKAGLAEADGQERRIRNANPLSSACRRRRLSFTPSQQLRRS